MERQYLNDGWQFIEGFCDEYVDLKKAEGFRPIRIPHTVKELPLNYCNEQDYQMISTYRRNIFAPTQWEGQAVVLTFEGAAHYAKVYVNGQLVKEHECGYTAFSIELTALLNYGQENLIVVELDSTETRNIPPFGYVIDYMTYGGIYRNVYLEVGNKAHVEDVFVKTKWETKKDAKLKLEVTVSKETTEDHHLAIYLQEAGKQAGEPRLLEQCDLLGLTKESTLQAELAVTDVACWNIDTPNLYWLTVELLDNKNTVLDQYRVRFGFREVEFNGQGFFLNGEKVKIRGLNRHQSYPYVGYAMPKSMQELDADILKKELGCNAVRTSHYPQSHDFINRCDEIGLLVFTEIPGWQHIGDQEWKNVAVRNVEEMVLQYRNHPSIFMWGVRINESEDDEEFYQRTNQAAHRLDDSRPTGGVRAHAKSQLLEDVYTFNDFVHDGKAPGCQPKAKVTTDMNKGYMVTEYNGHMYPTKAYDAEEHRVEHAMRHARVLDAIAGQEDIAGSFGWCMFDYNTHKDFGSGDRICYHGVMDMFRNPKLAAAVYASQQEKKIVLEPASSMDIGEHPASNRGDIYLFTNADSVKMYKNDIFIKEYTAKDRIMHHLANAPMLVDDFIGDQIHQNEQFTRHQADIIKESLNYTARHGYGHYPIHIMWKALQCMVRYGMKPTEAVSLYNKYIGDWGGEATKYRFEAVKNGVVEQTVVKEAITSTRLKVITSHEQLNEGITYDVAAVRIQAVDQNDNVLPFCSEPLTLKTSGVITLIGPDMISLQGGMGGTYVKTNGQKGEGTLTIHSQQMGDITIRFHVK